MRRAQPLWTCKECYVYQIPPLKNESGHRANDWNVDKWLWTGRLRVVSKGTMLKVLLEDATSGELFATCPKKSQDDKAIDPVVDSRRYFVLRIDDGKGHHPTDPRETASISEAHSGSDPAAAVDGSKETKMGSA